MNSYTEDVNPYKGWHMRRVFRKSWDAAGQGLDREQAQARVDSERRLNRMTTPAWWKGFDAYRGETSDDETQRGNGRQRSTSTAMRSTGTGWPVSPYHGDQLGSDARIVECRNSSEAELRALLLGMAAAERAGLTEVTFKTDDVSVRGSR
jgi:hypothetical protein